MRVGAAVVLIGALLLAGCSAEAPEPTSSADAEFTSRVASAISRAEAGGASDAQLAILRAAQEEGVLDFEPYKAAVEATFECFRGQGIEYRNAGTDDSLGFPFINYSVAGPESGPLPEASACEEQHSAFVAELYQAQPASQEASERRFLDAQSILIPCLEESGFLEIPNPTPDQVREAIWAGFDAAENDTAPAGFDPTACLTKAGITSGGF